MAKTPTRSRTLRTIGLLVILTLVGLSLLAARKLWESRSNGIPLAIRWEGAWHDYNTRDVGLSINQCLGETFLATDVLQRANGWFSGWSCAAVGSPDVLFSLNFDPARDERYYCRDGDHNKIGQSFDHGLALKDLEFLASWQDPTMRSMACDYLKASFEALASGQKVLVHCDAGRDRTGTYAALVTALAAEERGLLTPRIVDAIECDYRKTKSLSVDKYGRMERFIQEIQKTGGVRHFLMSQCPLSAELLHRVATRMTPQ